MPLEFRLLGSLEVERDGCPVPLGGAKERALLALLLLHANQPVSRDLLIDGLWARPPDGAVHALEARVSALRKRLQSPVLRTRPGGYLIEVEAGRLDLQRFESLLGEGREALADGDARRAEELLSEALAVWRGPPLADVAFEPVALAEAGRLEEERLCALEERAEARLALGRHDGLVAELNSLVAENPLRERFRRQLMLALYRSGRQAEALEVYRQGRSLLVEELGIEPGRDLQELQEAILRQHPRLDPPPTESEPSPERPVAVARLPEQRKVVTVLFCDVSDSTALGERLDPEALRGLLDRYFERMKSIVEHHGGTVEKFIGDAVMAVFGVPVLHDDDALRACRAACEMRDALPGLGVEARIGLATGEVLTGTEERFATGTAVNLAARLEQAASPGEIFVGADTVRLLGGAVGVEPVEPLRLKGLSTPTLAYRLVTAAVHDPARPTRAPFVGRLMELRRLRDAFSQAVGDRSCQLFTLLGAAGIGKSRLAAEFLADVDARLVSGRCLSYGEGITYSPVAQIIEQLGVRPADPEAAAAIAALLRESQRATSPEEIAWAFRKTVEAAAAAAPVVCVFDDLHWAEPPLLDLVEHVADLSRGAPILLLCLARPELYDRRPGWAGGKLNATSLLLAPLSADESGRLLDALGGSDGPLRARIIAGAEGNPLFLEEMLALSRESGDGDLTVPPTIHALLAARLDRLDATERTLLERAAVEGRHFDRRALEALSPDMPDLTAPLESLVRRDLICSAPSTLSDDTFSFRHELIRDVAYEALPKAVRADLHRRLAPWLAEHRQALVELDELVGYHLEQACLYDRELGRPLQPELAAEARRRLTAAGRRAFLRADHQAAASLLRRAACLEPDVLDVGLEVDLITSLFYSGEVQPAMERLAAAQKRAEMLGDRAGVMTLQIWGGVIGIFLERCAPGRLRALIAEGLPTFQATADHVGLFVAHTAAWMVAEPDDGVQSVEQALEEARLAGLSHWGSVLVPSAGLSRWYGSTPVSELLRWLDEQKRTLGTNLFDRLLRGLALAMRGRSDEALRVVDDWLAEDVGRISPFVRALAASLIVDLQLLVDDPAAAEEFADQACTLSEQIGERANHASNLLQLADAQCRLGRLDDAEDTLRRATAMAAADDKGHHAGSRTVEAQILARRGDSPGAEKAAREAVAIIETTQFLTLQANAYAALGESLSLADDAAAAADAFEEAARRYERKGDLVDLKRVRVRLTGLQRTRRLSASSAG